MATTTEWKTTIIVSTSLQHHEALRMLSTQQHRIRLSDSVASGAFVFPLSGTAFLVVDPQELPGAREESGARGESGAREESKVLEKIEMFVQVHRNSFLLLHVPFYGEKELDTLSVIQHRFFGSNLRILPVRNNADIVKAMLTIAKATSKPHVDSIRDRMSLARAHVIERSPVWEMLRDAMKLG
ncbi:protein SPO16 homolog [Diretmus argenteus]